MMGKYHVFFTFTPFNQLIVSSLLSSEHFTSDEFLVINSAEIPFSSTVAEVYNLSPDSGNTVARYSQYRLAFNRLQNLKKRLQIASVNAPHPYHIISNELMLGEHCFPVNIIEDGIGNYISSQIVGKLRSKSMVKRVISTCLGMNYRIYRGHFSGIDTRIMNSGFFLCPELIYRPDRFKSLHKISIKPAVEDTAIISTEERVLVLDQDIESIFSPGESRAMRLKLMEFTKSLNVDVLWKFHPTQKSHHRDLSRLNVEFLMTKETAELIALRYKPKYVVSFFSSALKNIKHLTPNAQCIALGAQELDRARGTSLAQVFENFSVVVK